ncbi:MAG: sigma-70 family RNA polymerase sigma factor [Cyanobacteriota bacterium]
MLTDESVTVTDAELVRDCQKGDRIAFRQLYQRYQQRVRSTLYQLCGEQLLDDLVQEVFLRTWKGLPKLRQPSTFSTWLYRICWNVANDQRRQFARLKAEKSHHQQAVNPTMTGQQNAPNLMHLYYQDLVQQGLETLSFEHRAVLVLHDLEDLPQKEVAKILAIPVGTVKSRLFHARTAMRQFLEQQGVSL